MTNERFHEREANKARNASLWEFFANIPMAVLLFADAEPWRRA
jgi:hypothetical protein